MPLTINTFCNAGMLIYRNYFPLAIANMISILLPHLICMPPLEANSSYGIAMRVDVY